MKRPGIVAYLFGNPLSIAALVIATGYFFYQDWTGKGSLAPVVLALLAMLYGFKANDALQKYGQWKREWNAMGDERRTSVMVRLFPVLRVVAGLAAWGFGLYLAENSPSTPGTQVSVALLWAAMLVAVVGFAYQRLKGRSASQPKVSRDIAVAPCMAPPRGATTLVQAYAELPAYCAGLIGR